MKQKKVINRKNIAIVCVNFSLDHIKKISDDGRHNNTHSQVVFKVIEAHFKVQFDHQLTISNTKELSKVIKKHFTSKKFTIIFDNLDQLYDETSTLILKTTENAKQFDAHYEGITYRHMVLEVVEIIRELEEDHNQRINCIFGMRKETYKALQLEINT